MKLDRSMMRIARRLRLFLPASQRYHRTPAERAELRARLKDA